MSDQVINEFVNEHLNKILQNVEETPHCKIYGSITRIIGMKLEAIGLVVPLGTVCKIFTDCGRTIFAEVIGFADEVTYLMATDDIIGIKQGSLVMPLAYAHTAKVGMALLGRSIDATGQPIDQLGPIATEERYSLTPKPINPLSRKRIDSALDVGIRAINALLTVGKGQRLGIFAGSGVGKSVLLGMMTRFTQADIVVVGLIGERGREVKEFIEENLGEEGIAKAVIVASPSDTSPLLRVNGAALATTIAEYYRDKGFDVLLIVDSLTRYAQAQREISLSVGELPATKGFTPTVFAKLAQLVERSGNGKEGQGSITAFYTVLVEGDDEHDPIADHARSLLDGHIFLSRKLADSNHYPAIDIERSVSRVMPAVTNQAHLDSAGHFRRLYSTYLRNKDLINVGMYQAGNDKILDEAIHYHELFEVYLKQGTNDITSLEHSINILLEMFGQKPKS